MPATDEQGNVRRDEHGRVIPRSTTIYDAASQLYREKLGRPNPIPTLCHREYMDPVGVCRVCVVQVSKFSKRTGGWKPAASCCRPASTGSRRR